MITSAILNAIADIDERNMTSILDAHGEVFDRAKRLMNLSAIESSGAHISTIIWDGRLVAYGIMAANGDSGLSITSIQVDKLVTGLARGVAIKQLIVSMLGVSQGYDDNVQVTVESHPQNTTSIALLTKLGFTNHGEQRPRRLSFTSSLKGLRRQLQRLSNQTMEPTGNTRAGDFD